MQQAEIAEGRSLLTLVSLTLVVGILYVASPVIIPIALALMLNFLLVPLVTRLQRLGIPRPIAIVTTVITAFGVIGLLGWMVSNQVVNLAEQLPQYEQTAQQKLRTLRAAESTDGVWNRAGQMVRNLAGDLESGGDAPPETLRKSATKPEENSAPRPIQVEVQKPKLSFVESVGEIIGTMIGPLTTAGLVIIFVIAMLFQWDDLRERLVKLISGDSMNVATEALDDAARRVTRYLMMQLLVNAAYGIPIGIGLYFIGIPNALLWGILATLLRFIPYLGPWIAAAFPIVLAFVIDPGWTVLLQTLALFLGLELVSNNFIEPWLYGASTGISNFALLVAAIFWTWLWGPVGLFLSTPLTVCVVVIGTYVPTLKFISVLLGSGPALEPHTRLYQRMLAMDYFGIKKIADAHVEANGLSAFYDQVLIPALIAAETDRHTGELAEIRQQSILENTRDLLVALDERPAPDGEQGKAPRRAKILILPAKDEVDALVGEVLEQMLAAAAISSVVMSARSTETEAVEAAKNSGCQVLCVSALPPAALVPARAKCLKLKTLLPDVRQVVAIWSPTATSTDLLPRLASVVPAAVVTSIHDAVTTISSLVKVPASIPMEVPPIPADEALRLKEIQRLDLLDCQPDEIFDNVTRELAKAFDVPISLVSIIDTDRQFWKAQTGLPADLVEVGYAARDTSVCGHVVALNEPLIIEDIAQDVRFANNPFLRNRGIRFYAGVPLRTEAGVAVGSLCVIDTKPRKVRDRDIELLSLLSDQLMQSVSRRRSVSG